MTVVREITTRSDSLLFLFPGLTSSSAFAAGGLSVRAAAAVEIEGELAT
ncbi:MAG: hypothetical protein ACE5GZ_06405 [Gammaproteobacteria bacterium]